MRIRKLLSVFALIPIGSIVAAAYSGGDASQDDLEALQGDVSGLRADLQSTQSVSLTEALLGVQTLLSGSTFHGIDEALNNDGEYPPPHRASSRTPSWY